MKPVGIITDSCSGISQKEASERGDICSAHAVLY